MKYTFDETKDMIYGQLGLLDIRLKLLEDITALEDYSEVMAIRESLVSLAMAVELVFEAVGNEFVHNDDLPEWRDSNPPETDL